MLHDVKSIHHLLLPGSWSTAWCPRARPRDATAAFWLALTRMPQALHILKFHWLHQNRAGVWKMPWHQPKLPFLMGWSSLKFAYAWGRYMPEPVFGNKRHTLPPGAAATGQGCPALRSGSGSWHQFSLACMHAGLTSSCHLVLTACRERNI